MTRILRIVAVVLCGVIAALCATGGPGSAQLSGRILDATGAPMHRAVVTLEAEGGGSRRVVADTDGAFLFRDVPAGAYMLSVSSSGFAVHREEVRLSAGESRTLAVRLELPVLTQRVSVSAQQVLASPELLREIPGSVSVIDQTTLRDSHAITVDEALRKAPGVHARGEEGFGLRPNIGIRGLNPTRSTKVLLLEDGIPLSYAPYGDNASYYHPPVDRFDSVEIVKGAGQILYGPMTVGGVINYITPAIPAQSSGTLNLTGGNRDYLNGHLRYGGTWANTGLLLDAMRKQGEGSRENTRSGLNDLSVKAFRNLSSRQAVSLKGNYYSEDSNVTYSGLRENEYLAAPRGNPFRNDFFYGDRAGLSALYTNVFSTATVFTSSVYGTWFRRHWWRQSSNSGQRPNDSADAVCAGMQNLNTTCGNEGRLREYYSWGVEPRFRTSRSWLGAPAETDFGFRAHFEDQDRLQKNGELPTSRDGRLIESNVRRNQAYSAFLQNRWSFGRWTFTPGMRVEHVRYERLDRLTAANGRTELTQFIPGIGLSFSPAATVTFFTGVHRGFAPPRTEDILTNAGGSVDLDPELSWNFEAGVRSRVGRLVTEATYFWMDYENQIIPASVAGGIGATLTSAGQTLHEGAEVSARYDIRNLLGSAHGLYLGGAVTYLPNAKFTGVRFSNIPGFTRVSVSGNRMPYAPRYLLTTTTGYLHRSGVHAFLEGVFTGRQFGDDLNTVNPTPDGQRGVVPGSTTWNLTVNYPVETMRTTLFASVKNVFDRTFIVDRTRGVLPNHPRTFVAGLRFSF